VRKCVSPWSSGPSKARRSSSARLDDGGNSDGSQGDAAVVAAADGGVADVAGVADDAGIAGVADDAGIAGVAGIAVDYDGAAAVTRTEARRTTRPCAPWPPARSCGRGFSAGRSAPSAAPAARDFLAVSWRSDRRSPSTRGWRGSRTGTGPGIGDKEC
jgi:hypothetical protein